MVTARRRGAFLLRLRAARQRAARKRSAVESGPPETARTRPDDCAKGLNRRCASAAEMGRAASAAHTLLLSLDLLSYTRGSARKLAQDFADRRPSRFLLAQCGKRLAKAHERIGRPGVSFVLGGDVDVGFGCAAIALALVVTFTDPIGGITGQSVVRV